METIKVATTQNIDIEYPLASLGDRILARLIDGVIMGSVIAALLFILAFIVDIIGLSEDFIWLIFVFIIPALFYHLLFEIFMNGQSPGKKIMNIRVISVNGVSPSFGNFLLRWLFVAVDNLFYGAVGMVCIASSEKNQRVGDMVANTAVIKLQQSNLKRETIVSEKLSSPHVVKHKEVELLTSADIRLVKEILENERYRTNQAVLFKAAEKIKEKTGIKTDMSHLSFLHTIVKDFEEHTNLEN